LPDAGSGPIGSVGMDWDGDLTEPTGT
jgi:hypothetical protein